MSRRASTFAAGLGALLVLCLLSAAPAFAELEQVANFAESGEGAHRLGNNPSLAVNATGAGGVPAGTLYAVDRSYRAVSRYSPAGEFREAWGWAVSGLDSVLSPPQFERCGPDGEPAHPRCGDVGESGEGAGEFWEPRSIAVDQGTGYVYVRNSGSAGGREHNLIEVFSADGAQLIAEFGDAGKETEKLDESPEKIHTIGEKSLAVDTAGDVYVPDLGRTMIWRPQSPGDYEHYVYAGRAADLPFALTDLGLDDSGNLYGRSGESIAEYDPAEPAAPKCEFEKPGAGILAAAVNPANGRVYYYDYKTPAVLHVLGACREGQFTPTGEITVSPVRQGEIRALVFNPTYSWPGHPAGTLYAADGFEGLGYVFAPAPPVFPTVLSESASAVTAQGATLEAQVNPRGSATHYAFQYLSEAAYEANHPDELQALTVSATGGSFSVSDQGHAYGGPFHADLTTGSKTATALTTAKGTAKLSAAKGTAKLKVGVGTGTVIAGSSTITALTTKEGAFEANQLISGPGIPPGTKVNTVKAGELLISAPATASQANAPISAGSLSLGTLATSEGAFEAGQQIEGEGIAPGTTITSAEASKLIVSKPPTKPGSGVAIKAGSSTLTSLTTSEGAFEAGQGLEGEGIAPATTIVSINGAKLTLSKPATKAGTAVALTATGPGPSPWANRSPARASPPARRSKPSPRASSPSPSPPKRPPPPPPSTPACPSTPPPRACARHWNRCRRSARATSPSPAAPETKPAPLPMHPFHRRPRQHRRPPA